MSIKAKILSWQVMLVVAVCAAMGLTALHLMVSSLTESQFSRLQVIAQDHAQQIAARIAAKAAVMERIAVGAAVSDYGRTYNDPALALYLGKFANEFPSLAYVTEGGVEELKLVYGKRVELREDVSGTELFQDALWERNAVHTALRVKDVDPAHASLGFAICRQSFFDEFEGAIMGWVPLSDILTDTCHGQIGKTGFLAVVDDQGTVLSHPQGDMLRKVTAKGEHSEQVLADAASMKGGHGRANLAGVDGYVAYSPVPGRNWIVFATLPAEEFMSAPKALGNVVMGVSVAVLIVCVIASALIAKTITTGLSKLAVVTGALAKGDLSQRATVASRDEVGALAQVFNHMAEYLQGTVERLGNEIRVREKAQGELVHAEKMGMLGQLVAGVAHEINTPTGAIMNVASDAGSHLGDLASAAADLWQLPEDLRRWLADEVPRIASHKANFAKVMDRQARREIEQDLHRQGVADARRVAEVLIDCGLTTSDAHAVRCLSQEAGLRFLEHLVALRVGWEISLISVQKIAKIVRALRYYSRSAEGALFDVSLNESLDNTLVILQNRIKRIAKVERHYDEALPPVRCGPDVSQVWTNILSNACDAVEATHTEGMGTIQIATRCADGRAVVTIANNGPPIPAELLGKIFDPFFTTKPIGEGTGLGLSICTGILRRYSGTISARNEPGRVVFEVSLPMAGGVRTVMTRHEGASAV